MTRSGYRKKPFFIFLLSAAYFVLPLLFLGQMLMQAGFSAADGIIHSEFFLAETALSWSAGAAVLAVSRLSFFYLIGLSAYSILVKSAHLLRHSVYESPAEATLIFIWLGATLALVLTTLRIPYLYPNTRWWKQPPRLSHAMRAEIVLREAAVAAVTLNLSTGGVFLRLTPSTEPDVHLPRLHLGDLVQARLWVLPQARDLFGAFWFESAAEVVWIARNEAGEGFQSGLGLEFLFSNREEKRKIRHYVKLLKRLGTPAEVQR